MLSYHVSFDSYEVFKQLDIDNNGYITVCEFQKYFEEDEDLVGTRFDLLIRYWNKGASDQLNYNQWRDGLSPYSDDGGFGGGNRFSYPRTRDESLK